MTITRGAGAITAIALTCVHAPHPSAATRVVAFTTSRQLDPPAAHGMQKLRDALRTRGFKVIEAATGAEADFLVSAGVGCASVARTAEALSIRRSVTQSGKPVVSLCGSDARGLMYAALDTADRIAWNSDPRNPFEDVRETTEEPYLAERGISMYTMHRTYFESRLLDERYWQRYFDLLAASRINNFVVIFGYENGGFMAPPYPYFFDVAQFPDVQFVGLTREQQARNTAAFKTMMRHSTLLKVKTLSRENRNRRPSRRAPAAP